MINGAKHCNSRQPPQRHVSCSTFPAGHGPSNCSVSAPSLILRRQPAALVYPMHRSHELQSGIAPHRAILHTKEVFVTEPEWSIVSSSRLLLPYARSPSHSQSQVRELGKLFLPPPLTDPHIFFSAISHRQFQISEDPVPLCFAVKIPQFIPHCLAR